MTPWAFWEALAVNWLAALLRQRVEAAQKDAEREAAAKRGGPA